jgi:hypothetical protein
MNSVGVGSPGGRTGGRKSDKHPFFSGRFHSQFSPTGRPLRRPDPSSLERCNREVCFARVSRHRQISRSGRLDIEARAFEEEPCFEMHQVNTVICNRVREAAIWAASLHALMLSPPVACPRHGDSSQRVDETTRLTPIPNSRVGFRSVLNNRCATSTFVAQRSSQRATRKSTRAANRG